MTFCIQQQYRTLLSLHQHNSQRSNKIYGDSSIHTEQTDTRSINTRVIHLLTLSGLEIPAALEN